MAPHGRHLRAKYLDDASVLVPPDALADVDALLASNTIPPRDLFAPVLKVSVTVRDCP